MDSLTQMNARLRRIFRAEETYGEGTPAEQARRFRLVELLPITIPHAVQNSAGIPREPVDLLISLSGFSPETTILAYQLLRPNRLMVIGSRSTEASVDVIQNVLKLPLSRIEVRYVDPTDPVKIYQEVREAAQTVPSRDGGRADVIIDITGGKKVMSASVALAAAQLDLRMCYIDGRFDPELRQSEPGSERLVIVPNPTALFGERELTAGREAFQHGAYAAAHDRFAEVADTAYEPAPARFLRDLADVYQSWCDLDLAGLPDRVAAMRERLSDAGYRPPADVSRRLREQLTFLDSLAELHRGGKDGPPLVLNFYLLGRHYQRLGRHDFAALLFYRTIESSFSLRLARIGSGFSGGRPDYGRFGRDLTDLAEGYAKEASAVHGKEVSALPVTVGLMDAAILLSVLGDVLPRRLDLTSPKAFGHLRNLVNARNRSVLAHGTDTVTAELSGNLENFALRALRAFWALEFPGEDVDPRIKALRFVVNV